MSRLATILGLALVIAGCAVVPVQDGPPVPAGPLGPIVPSQEGRPPVECRGVPIEQCGSMGNAGDPDVVRYIVTCTTVCTPERGDVRIDALLSDGRVVSRGSGGYASGAAEPAPEPAATVPG